MLCLALLLPCMGLYANADEPEIIFAYEIFTDVGKDAWYRGAAATAYMKGWMIGTSETTFEPDRPITREEFVTAFVHVANLSPAYLCQIPFSDVLPDKWYYEGIKLGYNMGVVKGIEENIFGVGRYITREDAALMIYKSVTRQKPYKCVVDDIDDVSVYARSAVQALTSYQKIIYYPSLSPPNDFDMNPLFYGDENGHFNPHKYLTRAEAALILCRYSRPNFKFN